MSVNNKKDKNLSVPRQQAIVSDAVTPTKSKRKVSFKEFTIGKNLKRGEIAGFKMYINNVEFMTEEEWNSIYNKYITRK